LKEAQKLGFTSAIMPQLAKKQAGSGMELRQMTDLAGFVDAIFGPREAKG
jgi:DNA repair protein RadA/Sms